MGVFYIGDREGRGGVFRRHCVGMILGWDFYWFGVGRGCDVFLLGGRVRKRRSWGRVDVLVCYGCVAGGVSVLVTVHKIDVIFSVCLTVYFIWCICPPSTGM